MLRCIAVTAATIADQPLVCGDCYSEFTQTIPNALATEITVSGSCRIVRTSRCCSPFTSGTSLDGKSAKAALLFTVDFTSVMMLFASADGDLNPVPQDYAESVGKAQVAAIEAGIPLLE